MRNRIDIRDINITMEFCDMMGRTERGKGEAKKIKDLLILNKYNGGIIQTVVEHMEGIPTMETWTDIDLINQILVIAQQQFNLTTPSSEKYVDHLLDVTPGARRFYDLVLGANDESESVLRHLVLLECLLIHKRPESGDDDVILTLIKFNQCLRTVDKFQLRQVIEKGGKNVQHLKEFGDNLYLVKYEGNTYLVKYIIGNITYKKIENRREL